MGDVPDSGAVIYSSKVQPTQWIQLGALVVATLSLLIAFYSIFSSRKREAVRDATAAEDRRRLLVGQVVTRLERITLVQSRPIFGRLWSNHQIEFALAVPQMALLATPEEEVLITWLSQQVQRMKAARSDAAAAAIAIDTTFVLASWFRGSRPLQWFDDEVLEPRVVEKSLTRRFRPFTELVLTLSVTAITAGITLAGVARAEQWVSSKLARSAKAWTDRGTGKRLHTWPLPQIFWRRTRRPGWK